MHKITCASVPCLVLVLSVFETIHKHTQQNRFIFRSIFGKCHKISMAGEHEYCDLYFELDGSQNGQFSGFVFEPPFCDCHFISSKFLGNSTLFIALNSSDPIWDFHFGMQSLQFVLILMIVVNVSNRIEDRM